MKPLNYSDFKTCEFVDHLEMSEALIKYNTSVYMMCNIPLHLLVDCLFHCNRVSIDHQHGMLILKRMNKSEVTKIFNIHSKTCEHKYITVLHPCDKRVHNYPSGVPSIFHDFPPALPNPSLCKRIINGFCEATAPSNFKESGCAVCGSLTLKSHLSELNSFNIDLSVLKAPGCGFTQKERKLSTEPITELRGNIMDTSCEYICTDCEHKVRCRKMPKFALVRGLWLGEIPEELQQLSFAEKLLIGRIRHNQYVIHVAKGMHKMIANAVIFEHPIQEIYPVLPPPIEEIDELLAFIFTGPCQPTADDFHQIPLLICRNQVSKALEWLKLDHTDYADIEISYNNLASHPEDSLPVVINY